MKGSFTLDEKNIPAISVIIPMYNAEKYIGQLLDSILAQTFTDYEVIVVDDCSKDNSAKIVESYVPKFTMDGSEKLRLIRLKVNSGAPGIPNNTGLKFARGEYISFLEADDAITPTAFEELYPISKEFNADVVHCEKYYEFHSDEFPEKNSEVPLGYQRGELVKVPTLIEDSLEEKIIKLIDYGFLWNVWTKLIRRDYILENNLEMVNVNHHDMIYTVCLVCSAKRYVRVPNVVNFYRVLEDSMSHKQENVEKTMLKYCKTLFNGFNYVEKFLSERDFFKQNPNLKYDVLNVIVREFVNYILRIYTQVPAFRLDEFIRRELEQLDDTTALTAFLFDRMNVFNVNLINQQQEIQKLQANFQKSVQYLKNQSEIIESQRAEIEQLKAQLQQIQ